MCIFHTSKGYVTGVYKTNCAQVYFYLSISRRNFSSTQSMRIYSCIIDATKWGGLKGS